MIKNMINATKRPVKVLYSMMFCFFCLLANACYSCSLDIK